MPDRKKKIGDYLAAISAKPPNGDPCITIGGQAVNFWCEQNSGLVPVLNQFRPFTSKDLDMVAHAKEQVQAIAKATKLKLVEAPGGYGPDLAAFVNTDQETVIQILSGMYGVDDRKLVSQTRRVELEDRERHKYVARVADIQALLKGKICNAISPDSMRSPEDKKQDRRHIQMLILCEQGRLKQLLQECESKPENERAIIKELKGYLQIATGSEAERVVKLDKNIRWQMAIPEEYLDAIPYPKVARFIKNEIKPWRDKVGPLYKKTNLLRTKRLE